MTLTPFQMFNSPMAGSSLTGQCKYRTFPSSQKVLLDNTGLEHTMAKIKSHSVILAMMYSVLTKKLKLNDKAHMKKNSKLY